MREASDGDQVALAGGTYEIPSLTISRAISVGGGFGTPPVIRLTELGFAISNKAASLHDVRIETAKPLPVPALYILDGTAERVFATASGDAAFSCEMNGGALRDSVCADALGVSDVAGGLNAVELQNIDAFPLLVRTGPRSTLTVRVVNSILSSLDGKLPDLWVSTTPGGSATVDLSHSRYATVNAGAGTTVTPTGTNGNITALPNFVNAGAGDFRQAPGSPTIDAGVSEPGLAPFDITGGPRSLPACIGGTPIPDIGAYEFVPTQACSSPPPPAQLVPRRALIGKLRHNRAKGTVTVAVNVAAAGNLQLFGKGLIARRRTATAAGIVRFVVKAKGRKLANLRRTGTATVAAKIAFTPNGFSDTLLTTKKMKLRLRR